jgi:hypothetical protein
LTSIILLYRWYKDIKNTSPNKSCFFQNFENQFTPQLCQHVKYVLYGLQTFKHQQAVALFIFFTFLGSIGRNKQKHLPAGV